ncbi:MAG: PBP1A family penicillin-binding protein [Elusimicrobiota bacterium]|nr:PBP1A family penicillin-binding protein [Elusimicrobiota bacterium]
MTRRRKVRAAAWRVAAFAACAAAAAAVWLCAQAERKLADLRLGGLGESFSTRVWSAPHPVRAGEPAEAERLLQRLDRLGYRRTAAPPAKGEYAWDPPRLTVHLRGHRIPASAQAEGVYALERRGDGTWSIADGLGNAVLEVRLEPELATELSGSRRVRRDPASWEQIPDSLRKAVVAAEDKRFWSHHGLDPRAIARAAWANLRGRSLQGASTITQQLSKNLFLSPRRTFTRKLSEAALAFYLELRLPKERILTLYLNHIYLGQDGASSVAGVRAAARFYFAKDAADLDLPEAALLAGLIRSPGRYDPFRDPAASRERRDQVLRRMREDGAISERELAAALAAPVAPVKTLGEEEQADHAYFTAEVVRRLLPRYGGEALHQHGLSIHTTMDPLLQSAAQRVLRAARHQAALVALDPRTGAVLALSGGKDFKESQFNRATQAQRQPGSTFKPFVYAAALETGFTPATILLDRPKSYPGDGRDWSPKNYDGYHGTATLRQGLALSLNAATLDLASRVSVARAAEIAERAGIASPIRRDLGLALGSSEVNLLELVAAYAPFAAGGMAATPRLVVAVVDAEGTVLEAPPPEARPVLDPAVASLMTSLLESVVTEGTARSLPLYGVRFPVAGKTGTTDDGRDAWFVGYTTALLAGAWAGDDANRALKLTGAKDALPLWAAFMKEAAADRPAAAFPRYEGLLAQRVCGASGMVALSGCPLQRDEWFIPGTEPQRECTLHRGGLKGWWDRLFSR